MSSPNWSITRSHTQEKYLFIFHSVQVKKDKAAGYHWTSFAE